MSELYDFHHEAMDLAFFALRARRRGDEEEAVPMFKGALENELKALDELYKFGEVVEPTYSVLHRSAATLALDCEDWRLAEKLAAKALLENPPAVIADELRDVWEQAISQRHLRVNGVELAAGELQMSLSGREVAFGMVPYNEFQSRVDHFAKSIHRTAERLNGLPFRERGGPPKDIRDDFRPFISAPRAASYAVTLRFGRPVHHQLALPGVRDTFEVVDEFVETMRILDKDGTSGALNRIGDEKYFHNFISLAKKIAPDGDRIQQVGFTIQSPKAQRSIAFRRLREEISPPRETDVDEKIVVLHGELLYADARNANKNTIQIVDDAKKAHLIEAPEAMMDDIVLPMWGDEVSVEAIQRSSGKSAVYTLLDIWRRSEAPSDEWQDAAARPPADAKAMMLFP